MPSGTAILIKYLEDNVGREISLNELNEVCARAGLHHWDRVIRNLRQQYGYDIENKRKQWYKLKSLDKKPILGKRGYISKKMRYLVFERDNFICRACGRSPEKDGVTLSPDHIVPVEWGGETTLENLQSLCRECNEGKQAWVKSEDDEIMKEVSLQTNAEDRLRVYFEHHPNEEISVDKLAVVAGTREWTRQIRYLRKHTGMKIEYRAKNKSLKRNYDAYIFLKEE